MTVELPTDQSVFWNRAAGTKVFTHPVDSAQLARKVGLDAPILDYGCGQGRLCGELAAAGFRDLRGVDSSAEMVRLAKQHHPALDFSRVEGDRLAYADASMQAALLVAVLTCIAPDAAQRGVIAELRRVLRPGGWLFVSDYPLQEDDRNRARYDASAQEFGNYGTFRLPDGAVVRHHRREWFAQLLDGFAIEETEEIDAVTMNGNPARILQFWARRL